MWLSVYEPHPRCNYSFHSTSLYTALLCYAVYISGVGNIEEQNMYLIWQMCGWFRAQTIFFHTDIKCQFSLFMHTHPSLNHLAFVSLCETWLTIHKTTSLISCPMRGSLCWAISKQRMHSVARSPVFPGFRSDIDWFLCSANEVKDGLLFSLLLHHFWWGSEYFLLLLEYHRIRMVTIRKPNSFSLCRCITRSLTMTRFHFKM